MKKIAFAFFLILFFATICFSQDTIVFKTHQETQAKVLEITGTEIKYKRFDNLDGPLFVIYKSDVIAIHYGNGTKDVFNVEEKRDSVPTPISIPVPEQSPVTKITLSEDDLYIKGQKDATRYYYNYSSASTGTLVTSLISPLLGLVPAIACSSTKPKTQNLNYPNSELFKDPAYQRGYCERAKKTKSNKVWTNWGIALGVNIVVAVLFVSGQ